MNWTSIKESRIRPIKCWSCGGKGKTNYNGGYLDQEDEDRYEKTKDRFHRRFKKQVKEDNAVPANNAGGGNVAGLGVGSQGEPAGKIASQKKKKKTLRDIISTKRM